ncbi:MAG TPA: hypothetical protein VF101_06375 [Gaiellaceae bacterium]
MSVPASSVLARLVSLVAIANVTGVGQAAPGSTLPPEPVLTFTRADGALAASAEDGTATTRLASALGGFVANHAWSPDGRRIAFTRSGGRNCRQGAVYVVDADGTAPSGSPTT